VIGRNLKNLAAIMRTGAPLHCGLLGQVLARLLDVGRCVRAEDVEEVVN
jgi:hypothetical protein